jgi:ABC-type enterochelin transport system substrate-binding protein
MGPRLALLAACLAALLAACGGGESFTDKELAAAQLVEAQAGEAVTCHDNHGVNSELHPEAVVGYSCFNEDGEFYNIVVAPDGRVVSLSGPVKLTPAGS